MTGRRLVGVLALIAFATAVLPPVLAWSVARARVARALQVLEAMAGAADPTVAAAIPEQGVVCGPGRLPLAAEPSVRDRMAAGRLDLAAIVKGVPLTPDPWGNCYLAWPSRRLLSAGPNGVVDTPMGADRLQGDDIGVRAR